MVMWRVGSTPWYSVCVSLGSLQYDPFFYYSLEVSESDFHILKKEQSLLVDFAAFPAKFIELLEQCIGSAELESPKYVHTDKHASRGPLCLVLP